MIEAAFKICDRRGLHMRPSTQLIQTVRRFEQCSFCLSREHFPDQTHSAPPGLSISALIADSIPRNAVVRIRVESPSKGLEEGLMDDLSKLSFWEKLD